MSPVVLADALDESRFGGKAAQLGAALRAGLPVPAGYACPWRVVAAAAEGASTAYDAIETGYRELAAGSVVVRSSAVGEDSGAASFAGQHLTVVNVVTAAAVVDAVRAVFESAFSPAALAYRERIDSVAPVRMGVVVQRLIDPICSGVMFTRHPTTGDDERVIEAAWGLGEAVVAGLVAPDRFRMSRSGEVIEATAGFKDVAVRPTTGGGTEEVEVPADLVSRPCLGAAELAALNDLASACERAFDGAHDIEWALGRDGLFLLQRRPVTGLAG